MDASVSTPVPFGDIRVVCVTDFDVPDDVDAPDDVDVDPGGQCQDCREELWLDP